MSPRRTILRELDRQRRAGAGEYKRPADIAGFGKEPAKYQAAINTLLQERLINGRKDEEGRLAIAINDDRLADVTKALRPPFARLVLLLAVLAVVAIGAAGLLMN
jgi:hypothetical protein